MENKKNKNKEIVRLREKVLTDGNTSLYLDVYWKGERHYDFLNLFMNSGLTQTDKQTNRETWNLAQQIKAQRLIDLQSGKYNVYESKSDQSFLDYFKQLTTNRYNSQGNYGNWDSCYKHLLTFAKGKDITFGDVDEVFLNKFKHFLLTEDLTKSKTKLSQNSCHSYYNKVRAALRQAFEERIIQENPAERLRGIQPGETKREFLSWKEIEELYKHPCDVRNLKEAFLFSVLTGLRWSDVMKMTWSEVRGSKKEGWHLSFQQKKTKDFEVLPITNEAREILGPKGSHEELVFLGLKYSAYTNVALAKWMLRAGIHRHITFHCARHTHATLLLTQGVDIYVVSKLLGHKHIKTTEIYTRVTNMKKQEAIKKLPKITLKRTLAS